ncbi:DJ-1/PfpI family protein [Actinomycetospora sp. TBRC 11914]|uniref:DJ-1/PfpI family protein n=1 Tax=Actinomycetospora sp. TBRC 11914 TaxID=2729387 RepID=UPI00145F6A6E|nr:DJ-1/PfpI family protein [Actinomycetospora sp. TBRC 11914]NMO91557.1 DJ-1/PfpI family protein [Actinomycetospora sp. TBRC 11914]
MRIEVVVFEGFDDLDAFAPHEVLHHAAAGRPDWEVRLVGVDGPATVTSARGVVVSVAEGLGEPDGVIVPGGPWRDPDTGVGAEIARGVLAGRLTALTTRTRWIASVCTGAMLLAAAGLTTGRPAVTHHAALDALAATGALVRPGRRVVDDGDVITAGGITSGLDLALHLVARELGPATARDVAALIEYVPQIDLDDTGPPS